MIRLPRWFWIAAFLVCWPTLAFAEPRFVAEAEGARIVLTDEPCKLDVANLKYRAVWTEKGKDFEGCYAPRAEVGVVLAYFADKTVVAIPIQAFTKVTGT